ncbi:hypothetical protein BH23VER1_BH23VER1_05680 [soil metagenome]
MLAAAGIALSACRSTVIPTPEDQAWGARGTVFWNPHRLFLSADVYPKLLVEIDVVDAAGGGGPSAEQTAFLANFLAQACDKPGGVEVRIDDRIPASEARGVPPNALALRHIGGPSDSRTAFIYVLYYDSRLAGEKENRLPETTLLPYPACIMIDRAYDPFGMVSKYGDLILVHETCHILGLTRNTAHGDGAHCTNAGCLMNATMQFSALARIVGSDPGHQRDLCPDCTRDLSRERAAPPPANVRFVGPLLVRSEPGYQVVALPDFVYLATGSPATLDPAEVTMAARSAASTFQKSEDMWLMARAPSDDRPATLRALTRAESDPYAAVSFVAKEFRQALRHEPVTTRPPE